MLNKELRLVEAKSICTYVYTRVIETFPPPQKQTFKAWHRASSSTVRIIFKQILLFYYCAL